MTSLSDLAALLRTPAHHSHKGQNGRLLIIGGSHLFHAASLWSLTVASRIVDLVHYASVQENNEIVLQLKKEFRNGIVIPRDDIEAYIEEDDVILIGPGMMRADERSISNLRSEILHLKSFNLKKILSIEDEGVQTYCLTKYLLQKYPKKQWVIDAGALQMVDLVDIPKGAILTPHHGEFELLKKKLPSDQQSKISLMKLEQQVAWFATSYNCIVLHKGAVDILASAHKHESVDGGNPGMTKGGTGDVLAGLIAALACSHDSWVSALAGAIINKQAGDDLFQTMGYWYNASDLADQIPKTMKNLLHS